MIIDITPETEHLLREELRSGHFRSVDDLIQSGVRAWRERYLSAKLVIDRSNEEETGISVDQRERPIWEIITDSMKEVPDEVFDRLPQDGASQVDHYIYNLPKRD